MIRRLLAWAGVSTLPRRCLALFAAVAVAAAFAALVGLRSVLVPPAPEALRSLVIRLAVVVALTAVAVLARLRVRIGSRTLNVGWGEAALIVGLWLVPAGWLPTAMLAGATLGGLLLAVVSDRRPPVHWLYMITAFGLSAAAAVLVARSIAETHAAPLSPHVAAALAAGAVTHIVCTGTLVAGALAVENLGGFWSVLLGALRSTPLMAVGNVVLGLVVVALDQIDRAWLVVVPFALWLLHQTYAHRLRADQEDRTWEAFAAVTGGLNQLDERGVADAGLRGALALFPARHAELEVRRQDGARRRYRLDGDDRIVEQELAPGQAAEADGESVVRALAVNGQPVGDLRLGLAGGQQLADRERLVLSAFGDALAAALHDAATHRELRIMAARSSYEAVHDPLTGLLNRSALLAKGDTALRMLERDANVALLLLDINQFKEVNDTLGHAAGDQLLVTTAARLSGQARPGELLARLGGDEFALLLTALPRMGQLPALPERPTALPQALRRARQLADQLAAPTEVAGVTLSVEASIGVVVAPAGGADMTELLRRADIAMYQAKEGGGAVAWYDSARDAASTDQLALLAEMREALAAPDQIVLLLQPAVDLSTGEPTGVEALVRWRHPRRGMLGPGDFVRAVEGSELLAPFTRYVIDQALRVNAEWAAEGIEVPIAVNLSARSLLDPRLPAEIAELLRRHRVPSHRLVMEITETVVMSELEVIDEVLAGLRAMGVRLAVDDFGTGYSSLTFLTRISVDELKVDRTFVAKMADSAQAAAIVRTTVELARELGLRVVAEGVETADQRSALAALGCSAAQGYHFFKPMPADKVGAVLRSLVDSASARIYPLRADGA
ncbi:putative bifunctional diguanylate cyclase/phosphodiesterase [Rhizomonospora bruguierae]|uniref:putative bifunctional diguanylate cyclase/phosphodiesterase n=1 Tax=Rhizomonospora bruguierae TaxID=1581705 RepID=UPI001BD1BCA3|nr:bifunctional diguanylate cyclase/phosphodiesterase [Micromonospora sp. NBRC 107566]